MTPSLRLVSTAFVILTGVTFQAASLVLAGSDEWGPTRNGLKTRLVPLEQPYVLGQPMRLRLEMMNEDDSLKHYDDQQVDVNNPLIVKASDGKSVLYVGPSVQTVGGPKPIKPGETVVLFYGLDLASQYYIGKPGRYTVQFHGRSGMSFFVEEESIPPSNILEIEVVGEKLPTADVVDRLLAILPEGWSLGLRHDLVAESEWQHTVVPVGRQPVIGFYHFLSHSHQVEGDDVKGFYGKAGKIVIVEVHLWQTRSPVEPAYAEQDPRFISEYLGLTPWGHVYVLIEPETIVFWPEVRKQLATALEVRKE